MQFISDLLSHHETSHDQQDLSEAQELIERLKALRPDTIAQVALEARMYKAQNQLDKAAKLIQTAANRPNLPEGVQQALAKLAEDLGQFDLAERLLRQLMRRSERVQNRLMLASYLGRRGKTKEALDECERLWKETTNPEEQLVQSTLGVLFSPSGQRDPAQVERVADWIQKGMEQNPKSSNFTIASARLCELRGRWKEAEALYRQVIDQGEGNGQSRNNLACDLALNNLANLLALRSEKGTGALELVNRAIAHRGRFPIAELLDTRGVVYMKMGDSQHAIEDLDRATTLDPTGPKYFHFAQAYLRE